MNFAVVLLSALLVVLVFLPNRFCVQTTVDVAGWEIFVYEWTLLVVLVLVWLQKRGAEGAHEAGLFRPRLLGVVSALYGVAVLATLIPLEATAPTGQGLAAVGSIALWTWPVLALPSFRLTTQEIKRLLLVFALLAVLGAVFTVSQSILTQYVYSLLGWKYVVYVTDSERRGDLPLGVATVVGAFFMMAIPLAWVLFLVQGGWWRRCVGVFAMVILGMGCLFTSSRSTVALSLLVIIVCAFWLRHSGSSKVIPYLAVVLLLCMGGISISQLNFERLTTFRDRSVAWRQRGIETAIEIIEKRPLLGSGAETYFRRQHPTVIGYLGTSKGTKAIYYDNRLSPMEPHNTYLFLTAEWGLAGLAFFLLLVGRAGFWFQRAQRHSNDSVERLWMRAFMVGFGAVLLHCMTGSDLLRQARLAPLFWIYCGLGLSLGQNLLKERYGISPTSNSPAA